MNNLLTVTQVAKRVNCTRMWIFKLIKSERLKAQMVGNSYVIKEQDFAKCRELSAMVARRTKPQAAINGRSKVGMKTVAKRSSRAGK